jgi:hypothetical protein
LAEWGLIGKGDGKPGRCFASVAGPQSPWAVRVNRPYLFCVAAEPALSEVEWACRLHFDFEIAAGTAASTGKILPDLELLAMNFYRRWRRDDSLLTGSIRYRFNHPLPAGTATFVESSSCATALKDLHSPIVAVSRKREHIRDCGRDHHAEQGSNQKYAHHSSCPHGFLIRPS